MEKQQVAELMLDPRVLEAFGTTLPKYCYDKGAVRPVKDVLGSFGYLDLRFPSMLKAASFAQIWREHSGERPPITITRFANDLFLPVTITVHSNWD